MFHTISASILDRMAELEAIDDRDRKDGTPQAQRLRQVPPEVGKLLALLAACAPVGEVVDVGTSAGYSTLWLSLACRQRGDRLTTFEIMEEKVRRARQTFAVAEVEAFVDLIQGDALQRLTECTEIAFCFLDAEKGMYSPVYELVVPRLVQGGLLVADNIISHQEVLQAFVDRALMDVRVDALVVPLGKGLLVCRKV